MIYFFPGLATDGRLLNGYRFAEPLHVVQYPLPAGNEELDPYVRRLLEVNAIKAGGIFLGFSLGGMMAAVASRQIHVRQCIVISTLIGRRRPFWINLPRRLPLHHRLPDAVLQRLILWLGDVFGRKSPAERRLLQQMVMAADMRLVRWALDAVPRWTGLADTSGIIQIHGSSDRLFPLRYVRADVVIAGGRHFMIVQQQTVLQEQLDRLMARAIAPAPL